MAPLEELLDELDALLIMDDLELEILLIMDDDLELELLLIDDDLELELLLIMDDDLELEILLIIDDDLELEILLIDDDLELELLLIDVELELVMLLAIEEELRRTLELTELLTDKEELDRTTELLEAISLEDELDAGENIELTDEFELVAAAIELADEEVSTTTVLLELTDIMDELVTAVFEEVAPGDELDASSSFSPPQLARATPNVNIVNTLESILVISIIFVSRKEVKLLQQVNLPQQQEDESYFFLRDFSKDFHKCV